MSRRTHPFAYSLIAFLLVVSAAPAMAQSGGGGSSTPSPPPSTGTSTTPRSSRQTPRPGDQMRGPTFISGRILSDLGRPMSEPVSVELNCGMRPVQVIHSDLSGYFTFNLSSGAQSNMDFSASNESPMSFTSAAANLPNRYGNPLAGCELRLSVAGFRPKTVPLMQASDMGKHEVGNIMLERIGTMKGSAVSVTSLLVPKEASREFERAIKELQNNKPDAALPHLEKAVAAYDKYAAAWNELGRLYLVRNDRAKAEQAFEKATAADPDYLPPWINLATMQIQNREWAKGAESAARVLELNPELGYASFLQAVAYYNLNNLDQAERNAKHAEEVPHADNPQVHALLARIYMDRQDYHQAAEHMRSYLEESPNGPYAEQMKKDLKEIEEWFRAEQTAPTTLQSVPPPPVLNTLPGAEPAR